MYDLSMLINNIQRLTDDKNISINKMLLDLGLNKDVFRHLKDGKLPSIEKVHKIADYFDVSIDYLLGRTDKSDVNR